MHICVSKLTIVASDDGLVAANAGILLIHTLRTNFNEILSESHTLSFKKLLLKMASVKLWQFYLGFNHWPLEDFNEILDK